MIVGGIDVGFGGGVAFLEWDADKGTRIRGVYKTPLTLLSSTRGKTKRIYDIKKCIDIFRDFQKEIGEKKIEMIGIEKVNAMPSQGVISMFSLGMGFMLWQAVVTFLELPYLLIPPITWQRDVMVRNNQLDAKSRAFLTVRELFPELNNFIEARHLAKGSGIIDALLIAEYVKRKCIGERIQNEGRVDNKKDNK